MEQTHETELHSEVSMQTSFPSTSSQPDTSSGLWRETKCLSSASKAKGKETSLDGKVQVFERVERSMPMTSTTKLKEQQNSSHLPATIDPSLAVTAFRSQREGMLSLIRYCLPSLANSLHARFLISQDVYEEVTEEKIGKGKRTVTLLDCVEARCKAAPSDFAKVVYVLESEAFLELLASQMVQKYCDLLSAPSGVERLRAVSSAISRYAAYLKKVYKASSISHDGKWPPTPSREYIQLAIVEEHGVSREWYIGDMLKGKVENALGGLNQITLNQILEPCNSEDAVGLILIEGAPGIGKSTLAWELCRGWEEFPSVKQYSLVVLLRLREKRVQQISQVSDIIFSCKLEDKDILVDELQSCHGRGILFILDGFDELPVALQHEGFLVDLIKKRVLPGSSVVVTSRPSAIAELRTSCHPQQHIKILGFTQESVEKYASSIFSSDPTKLRNFKSYISASSNPAINSLMYVPINAAIIVHIYMNSASQDSIPRNLTQLYTQLCLTILNKYIKIEHPSLRVHKFTDLPDELYKSFLELSAIAFNGISTRQITFHSECVSPSLNHFGFLDAVPALYGGGETSYNFLHLTIQEFFAAYHISQLPDHGVSLFKYDCNLFQWDVVWRFVAGLTKFHFLKHMPKHYLKSTFFIHCLFESQIVIDVKSIPETESITVSWDSAEKHFDYYALGYCITNCFTEQFVWNLMMYQIANETLAFFLQGLMYTTSPNRGRIKKLHFLHHSKCCKEIHTCLSTMETPLTRVVDLSIAEVLLSEPLVEMISCLTHLQKLSISFVLEDGKQANTEKMVVLKFLKQISKSKVTSLNIIDTEIELFLHQDPLMCSAFQELIHPSSGILRELSIGSSRQTPFCMIKLIPSLSSLQQLLIFNRPLYNSSPTLNLAIPLNVIKHFEINHQSPFAKKNPPWKKQTWSKLLPLVVNMLRSNNTVKHLHLMHFNFKHDVLLVQQMATALQANTTLESLTFHGEFLEDEAQSRLADTIQSIDSRVKFSRTFSS